MILNEKFNPYIKAVRIFFFGKLGHFFYFQRKKRRNVYWILSVLNCRNSKLLKSYANKDKGSGH